jgi:hypothetical protein
MHLPLNPCCTWRQLSLLSLNLNSPFIYTQTSTDNAKLSYPSYRTHAHTRPHPPRAAQALVASCNPVSPSHPLALSRPLISCTPARPRLKLPSASRPSPLLQHPSFTTPTTTIHCCTTHARLDGCFLDPTSSET